VIIHENEYNQKVNKFITTNKFTKLTKDQTHKQQKAIRTVMSTCNNTIKNTDKWKYINMNPITSHIHGTIKLHKEHKPIRPTVNWKNSPGYKLATYLEKQLKSIKELLTHLMYQTQKNLCIISKKSTYKET
jgi:sugar (pentulose or hexulose) kinase